MTHHNGALSATTTLAGDRIAGGDGIGWRFLLRLPLVTQQTAYTGMSGLRNYQYLTHCRIDHGGKLSGWFDNGELWVQMLTIQAHLMEAGLWTVNVSVIGTLTITDTGTVLT